MTPWLHRDIPGGSNRGDTAAIPPYIHIQCMGLKSANETNLHGSHTEHQDIFTGVNRGQNRESGIYRLNILTAFPQIRVDIQPAHKSMSNHKPIRLSL